MRKPPKIHLRKKPKRAAKATAAHTAKSTDHSSLVQRINLFLDKDPMSVLKVMAHVQARREMMPPEVRAEIDRLEALPPTDVTPEQSQWYDDVWAQHAPSWEAVQRHLDEILRVDEAERADQPRYTQALEAVQHYLDRILKADGAERPDQPTAS